MQGIGPQFKVSVILQNTSPDQPLSDHYIVFQSDETLYSITKKYIKVIERERETGNHWLSFFFTVATFGAWSVLLILYNG